MKLIVAALVGACAVFTGLPSALADKVAQQAGGETPSSDVPDVPGENIFGFTDPTDVGKPGDTAPRVREHGPRREAHGPVLHPAE